MAEQPRLAQPDPAEEELARLEKEALRLARQQGGGIITKQVAVDEQGRIIAEDSWVLGPKRKPRAA